MLCEDFGILTWSWLDVKAVAWLVRFVLCRFTPWTVARQSTSSYQQSCYPGYTTFGRNSILSFFNLLRNPGGKPKAPYTWWNFCLQLSVADKSFMVCSPEKHVARDIWSFMTLLYFLKLVSYFSRLLANRSSAFPEGQFTCNSCKWVYTIKKGVF